MEGNRATNPSELWIDYVDPYRAGVKAAVGVPVVTSEMQDTSLGGVASLDTPNINPTENKETPIMTEKIVNADVIQLQEQVNQLVTYKKTHASLVEILESSDIVKAVTELQRRVVEAQPFAETVESVVSELGTQDIVKAIRELKADRDTARAQALGFTAKNLVVSKVTFAGAYPMIAEMIGLNFEQPELSRLQFESADEIAEQIDNLLNKSFVQETIKAQVLAVSGGRAFVTEQDGQSTQFEDTPEARAKARSSFNF